MDQQLKTLVALTENLSFWHLHGSLQPTACNFSSRHSNTSFWPPWAPGMYTEHTDACEQTYTKLKIIKQQ